MNPTIKYIRNTFIGYYNPDTNTIYLNKRLKKPEFKEYCNMILRHELGHHKRRNNKIKDYLYELKEGLKNSLSPKHIIHLYKFKGNIEIERGPGIIRILDPIFYIYSWIIILFYFVKKSIIK